MVGHDEGPQGIGRFNQLEAENLDSNGTFINVAGNLKMAAGTAIAGTATGFKISNAAAEKIGFYGTAPVAQQTGVAVSAAAIHAALVNLGLITA